MLESNDTQAIQGSKAFPCWGPTSSLVIAYSSFRSRTLSSPLLPHSRCPFHKPLVEPPDHQPLSSVLASCHPVSPLGKCWYYREFLYFLSCVLVTFITKVESNFFWRKKIKPHTCTQITNIKVKKNVNYQFLYKKDVCSA